MRLPPATYFAALGLSESALHAFAAALQGEVAAGFRKAVPSSAPSGPTGKVTTLSILHIRFPCGVEVDGYHPPICEAVARGKGRMEGLATLNQALMRGLPSCSRVFGGRAHFSASLPLLAFVKNVSLLNPSLDSACTGGGFTTWLNCKGSVEASTCGGADASLIEQHLDRCLASEDSLQMSVRVRLAVILSADEALRDIGTYAFVALHLFSAGESHSSTISELLCLIERMEDLHTVVKGMISSPHLATKIVFGVSRRWIQYLNMCVVASALEVVEALGGSLPFSLEPILFEMEGGRYIGPILPASLANLVKGRRPAGWSAPNSGGGGGSGGDGGGGIRNNKPSPKVAATGGSARVKVRYYAHLPSFSLWDVINRRWSNN